MTEQEKIQELLKPRYRKEPLQWFEKREPEELPVYIKEKFEDDYDEGDLPRVYKFSEDFQYGYDTQGYPYIAEFKTGGGLLLDYTLPATLAEYTQYIKSKPQP